MFKVRQSNVHAKCFDALYRKRGMTDKTRADFEAVMRAEMHSYADEAMFARDADGEYVLPTVYAAFFGWQAATAQGKRQPLYPDGDVVGPCVCGSWPGGKCLKCQWITATPQGKI